MSILRTHWLRRSTATGSRKHSRILRRLGAREVHLRSQRRSARRPRLLPVRLLRRPGRRRSWQRRLRHLLGAGTTMRTVMSTMKNMMTSMVTTGTKMVKTVVRGPVMKRQKEMQVPRMMALKEPYLSIMLGRKRRRRSLRLQNCLRNRSKLIRC